MAFDVWGMWKVSRQIYRVIPYVNLRYGKSRCPLRWKVATCNEYFEDELAVAMNIHIQICEDVTITILRLRMSTIEKHQWLYCFLANLKVGDRYI